MNSNASKLSLIAGGATVFAAALGMVWRAVRGRRREPKVGNVMTRQPVRIDAGASAESAAARMAEEAVGALAVCDASDHPVGVITDRDLVVRVLAQGEDPRRATVSDCLDGEVETVDVDAPLSEAAARMMAAAVRRLPVLRSGRLAGILTLADITDHDPATAVSLERTLMRARADERSAAWLFRRPYRRTPESPSDTSRTSRVADGQLTTATRNVLAETRAHTT